MYRNGIYINTCNYKIIIKLSIWFAFEREGIDDMGGRCKGLGEASPSPAYRKQTLKIACIKYKNKIWIYIIILFR